MTDALRSRRWVLRATGITIGSGLAAGTAGADTDDETDLEDLPTTFAAELTAGSVPRDVETDASGTATFEIDFEERAVHYVLDVDYLCDPTDAHIGYGADGETGERFVQLYPGADDESAEGRFDGTLAEGTLTVDELLEAFERHDLETVAAKLADREIYVGVATEANPEGEIRGQIVLEDGSSEVSETDDLDDADTAESDTEEEPVEDEEAAESDTDEEDADEPIYRAPADPDDAADDEDAD
ncbi:CHRD domain-containing protein [Natronococcus sp. A-GB7]|uniref:CHRD domain-containing protein n=1 Tax=Natronococcus sp. A-GB7 TaxID=3037649 RepID=UPI00241EEDA0|nr:CHRD domain-containing protein [Natronococcus sp. A-GB7]MDG5817388.1 CHRD domain-containing protein [Natronococcus sp. A-GB7]